MYKLPFLAGIVPLVLAAGIGGPAAAAESAQDRDAIVAASDPERMICRRVEETGSRLKARRVCMTRTQWDEQRRQNRMSIERGQTQTRVETPEG